MVWHTYRLLFVCFFEEVDWPFEKFLQNIEFLSVYIFGFAEVYRRQGVIENALCRGLSHVPLAGTDADRVPINHKGSLPALAALTPIYAHLAVEY